jgi:thiol-disulfide isomerase/thioredoxin
MRKVPLHHTGLTRRFVRVAAVAVVAVMLATCNDARPDAAGSPVPARNATTAPLLPTDALALPTLSVARFRTLLAQLRGTPVVVNIWASWCGPCEAEAPLFEAALDRYGDRVQFVGVDILDSIDGARAFIREHRIGYPSVFDPQGSIRNDLGHFGQPVTLFYAADGALVRSIDGQIGPDTLDEGIRLSLG